MNSFITSVSVFRSPGGDAEVLLYEVEGHRQGNQRGEKDGCDEGYDPDGRQTQQRGPRQRLQRRWNMLTGDDGGSGRRGHVVWMQVSVSLYAYLVNDVGVS